MAGVDKLIVTNVSALARKYGATGLRQVRDAMGRLVAADRGRGLVTRLIALDDRRAMRRVGGRAVRSVADAAAAKAAIDALHRALTPSYLMILGSVDVVPHQRLRNPLYTPGDPDGDTDRFALGDLPYACEAPYSRKPEDFRGPTRVVGRLSDMTGGASASFLVALLDRAAGYVRRSRAAYVASWFGLSASPWRKSTTLSLQKLFGPSAVPHVSPREGPRWTRRMLAGRIHFINCHGAEVDSHFYGQRGEDDFPVAHDSGYLDGRTGLREGTVVAAECCYGAELYDPQREDDGVRGICYAYLAQGAYGFFGSSTTAYGPPRSNGSADLICRYFLESVLAGASLGRATLEARQRFVDGMSVMTPEDVKTLAQFNLLGDPAIHPVTRPADPLERTPSYRAALAGQPAALPVGRALRRDRLLKARLLLPRRVGYATRPARRRAPAAVRRVMTRAAREAKLRTYRLISFRVTDPGRPLLVAARRGAPAPASVHVVIGSPRSRAARARAGRRARRGAARKVKLIVVMSVVEQGGKIVRMRLVVSR
jgi:peptidase C25-like protein